MSRFLKIFAVLLIGGCTISNDGITPWWMEPKPPIPVVVEPKKVTTHEFRFMLVECGPREELPLSQLAMITGKNLRDFLKANCVKDGFRFIDTASVPKLVGVWKEMMPAGEVTQGYPLMILKNGDAYLAKKLPTDWAELKMDLEQYAGVMP